MSGFLDEPSAGAGLTPLETAILARWDGGESIEQIVRSGDFAAGAIKETIYRFAGAESAAPRWARRARAGSEAMARAIAATGRSYT